MLKQKKEYKQGIKIVIIIKKKVSVSLSSRRCNYNSNEIVIEETHRNMHTLRQINIIFTRFSLSLEMIFE